MLERTLFDVTVKESEQNRGYWASREWIGNAAEVVRSSEILIVPWEDFREGVTVLFPQGTGDLMKRMRAAGADIALAVPFELYSEIALHAHAWRFPTLLVKFVLLPAVASLLAAEVHDVITKAAPSDIVEMKVIVEGDHGKCISIEYKGEPGRALDTLTREAERCLPRIVHDYASHHANLHQKESKTVAIETRDGR